ncbi:hypothetical protein REPUB_Repub10bG0086500 [Reevesia pubescens]
MGGGCFKQAHVNNAYGAEALAARRAMELACDLGFHIIVLEGDSLSVMKSLSSKTPDLSPIGPIIDEARTLSSMFHSSVLSHANREQNQAAHCAAKLGLQFTMYRRVLMD